MPAEHTKTPWKVQDNTDAYTHIVRGPDGEYICAGPQGRSPETVANMTFIVKAVNHHERLVEALDHLLLGIAAAQEDCIPVSKGLQQQAREVLAEVRNV